MKPIFISLLLLPLYADAQGIPRADNTRPAVLCAGSETTLQVASAGGVWRSSNTAIASISNAGVVKAIGTGVDTISYSLPGATTSFKINVESKPVAGPISATEDSVCLGCIITLVASPAGGTWVSTNTAEAGTKNIGVLEGYSPGDDTVYYIAANACGTDTSRKIIAVRDINLPPEIKGPISISASISVHLDPAHRSLHVMLNIPGKEEAQMTLYNIKGQKVQEFTMLPNENKEVPINLPPGTYYVTTMLNHNILYSEVYVK